MSIDYESTAQKEIRYQSELFRILTNVKHDGIFYQFTYPSIKHYGLELDKVLVEATILDDNFKVVGEADLILIAEDPKKPNILFLC